MFNCKILRLFCLTILLFSVLVVGVWGNDGYGTRSMMGNFANRRTMSYPQINNGPCTRTITRCIHRNRSNRSANQQQTRGYFQQKQQPHYQVPTARPKQSLSNEQLNPMTMLVSSINKQAPYIPLESTASQNAVSPTSNRPDCYRNQPKQSQTQSQEQGWAPPQIPPSTRWFQQPNQPRSNHFAGNTQGYQQPQSLMPKESSGSYPNKMQHHNNQEWPKMDESKYQSGQQTEQQSEPYTSVAQNQQEFHSNPYHQIQPCSAEAQQQQKPINGQWPRQFQKPQQPEQSPCIATNQPQPPEQWSQQPQFEPQNSLNMEYSQPQQQPFYHGPSSKPGFWKMTLQQPFGQQMPQQQPYPQETGNGQWGPQDSQIREIELPNLGQSITVITK